MDSTEKRKLYWQSLSRYNSSRAELQSGEFRQGATDDFPLEGISLLSRRKFMALLGASAAFAAAGCTDYRDKGSIVPYNKKPEEITAGVANYYASSLPEGLGILVKTREGRPIKVDGNPGHPINKGKIDATGLASILNLYDPERLRKPLKKQGGKFVETSWADADKEAILALTDASSNGKEIAIITHSILSPTQKALLDKFAERFPGTKIYSYELFSDMIRQNAWKISYGQGLFPKINWHKANVILALEADFLGAEGTPEIIRMYSERRNADKPDEINKLYCAEAAMSLTGANADYRLRLTPEEQLEFVMCLINEIVNSRKKCEILGEPDVSRAFAGHNLTVFARKNKLDEASIRKLVDDLVSNCGKSMVCAGDTLPEKVHVAVNFLNEVLGNTKLYCKKERNASFGKLSGFAELKKLNYKFESGSVGAAIFFDTNPAYHFPHLLMTDNYRKVKFKAALTESENETSDLCDYSLPINHYLESWGDFQLRDSLISLQQPVIGPLYNSRQKEEILLRWMNEGSGDYFEFLKKRWKDEVYPMVSPLADFEKFWNGALHEGFINIRTKKNDLPKFDFAALSLFKTYNAKKGYTVLLKRSSTMGDGRYANNGWLQEIPHPVSKVCWDNYAAISPGTAKEQGLKNGDHINLSGKCEIPVIIQPGMADKTISIELGYGRKNGGTIGSKVGFDAGMLMASGSGLSPWISNNYKIKVPGRRHIFASTQEHHALDDDFVKDFHKIRDIIREGTVKEYKNHPHFLHEHAHEVFSITENKKYEGVKWGMAIDMNKCIGCERCVAACNVENNVPVVGKAQVLKGREMQWMRIDRYYSGTPDEPEVSFQPMLCQHCDNAPCENVCPVVATTHSPDGLNQMTYNRCVGTRYCANNCPYKVRRFNFFDFREYFANGLQYKDSLKLLSNPEVTVRSRGVMEKCTFCVQRIMEARQNATREGREFKGSDVVPACVEACPADAIVFGDLNDPDSRIAKLQKHNLGYKVLELLNVRPNVTYIAKLRNKDGSHA